MKPAEYMHKLIKENGDEFANSVANVSRLIITLGMVESMEAPKDQIDSAADAMSESIAHVSTLLQEMGGFDGEHMRDCITKFIQLCGQDQTIH